MAMVETDSNGVRWIVSYANGVETSRRRADSSSGRAPIQNNTVTGANAGGNQSRSDSLRDLRNSSRFGGRTGGNLVTINPDGTMFRRDRVDQYGRPLDVDYGGKSVLDGSISGLAKSIKMGTVTDKYTRGQRDVSTNLSNYAQRISSGNIDGMRGDRSGRSIRGRAGGLFGTSTDAATQNKLNNMAQNESMEKTKYRFDPRTGKRGGLMSTDAGIRNQDMIDADATAQRQSEVKSLSEDQTGGGDIKLTFNYDGEGNITGIKGYEGTTGIPALDRIRFNRYSDMFNNSRDENSDITDKDLADKYASQEEEAMMSILSDDQKRMMNDRYESNIMKGQQEEQTKHVALAGGGQDRESSLERMMKMANDQRDKEYAREEATRDADIKRIDTERAAAEKKLKKRITEDEKRELQRMKAMGYMQTTAKGKELMSSQSVRSALSENFAEQLSDGMSGVEDIYNKAYNDIQSSYNEGMDGIDANYYEAMMGIEQEKIRFEQEDYDRQIQAQSDLEESELSWTDTLAEYKKLIGENPEMADALSSQLRNDLIEAGIIDASKLDNIVGALKSQAERDLANSTSLMDQRDRSNQPKVDIPPTYQERFGKLSAGAQNLMREGLSLAELQALRNNSDKMKEKNLTASVLDAAINFMQSQGGGGTSIGSSNGGWGSDQAVIDKLLGGNLLVNE